MIFFKDSHPSDRLHEIAGFLELFCDVIADPHGREITLSSDNLAALRAVLFNISRRLLDANDEWIEREKELEAELEQFKGQEPSPA